MTVVPLAKIVDALWAQTLKAYCGWPIEVTGYEVAPLTVAAVIMVIPSPAVVQSLGAMAPV